MPTLYTVIRRPLITEKGMTVKGRRAPWCSRSRSRPPRPRKAGGREPVQGQGYWCSHRDVEGKERRRGKFAGYRPDWKKAYVRLKDGEKVPEYLNSSKRDSLRRERIQEPKRG